MRRDADAIAAVQAAPPAVVGGAPPAVVGGVTVVAAGAGLAAAVRRIPSW